MNADDPQTSDKQARQKAVLLVLATALIVGGFIVLFALKRIPLPLRLVIGCGDLIAASALLLLLRQQSGRP